MKKLSVLFASIVFAFSASAAEWCSLRAVASQTEDKVCCEVVPEIDWSKSGVNNLDLLIAVYFYDEWMNALKSDDKLYEAANGQVAANTPYSLDSSVSDPSLDICIPIDQLHMGKDGGKLYYTVEVFRIVGGTYESLASTQPHLLKVNTASKPDAGVDDIDARMQQYNEVEKEMDELFEIAEAAARVSAGNKTKKEGRPVSTTFRRTYRNVWDDDLCEEMRFYKNGKVELFRIFKGYDENFIKEGTYILNSVEGSPRITIHIDWKTEDSEKTWKLGGSSRDHSLFKDKQEWKPVSVRK